MKANLRAVEAVVRPSITQDEKYFCAFFYYFIFTSIFLIVKLNIMQDLTTEMKLERISEIVGILETFMWKQNKRTSVKFEQEEKK